MSRELPHWKYFELIEVELSSGDVGYGETMTFYTWGDGAKGAMDRVIGANAAELMWDDSLGAGLQIALFDAVGKAMSVPVSALLGNRIRSRVPVSWWCIDMPPEDWLSECQLAIERGYTRAKLKGRPWFDIRAQIELLSDELPESFSLDIDFNDTLLTAEQAIPLLQELAQYPQVSRFETPIPQEDVAGNERISDAIDADLVHHYGTPNPVTTIRTNLIDGFVLMGGASRLVHEASIASMAEKSAWLQLVGTGITTAFSLHCASVFDAARWSSVNCFQIFDNSLLTEPIDVEDGHVAVPEGPGLGVTIDRDLIERYRVDDLDSVDTSEQDVDNGEHTQFYARMQTASRPSPQRLIETRWPDGTTMYFSGRNDQLLRFAQKAEMPYFERDVTTRVIPDDGSERWNRLHESATDESVVFTPESEDEAFFDA